MTSNSKVHAENYYLLSQDSQEKYFLDLLSGITIPPGNICLYIGCGTGNLTSILAVSVGEEGYVCGIDPDVNRIAVATENHKNIPNLEFVIAKGIDIPQYKDGYDIVVCSSVLHWINHEEKLKTFKRVFDVLKHGAIFLVNAMKEEPVNCSQLISYSPSADLLYSTFYPESENSLTQMLKDAGFEIVNIDEKAYISSFSSAKEYVDFQDSVLFGICDLQKVYEEHKDKLEFHKFDDGRIIHEECYLKFILRKP